MSNLLPSSLNTIEANKGVPSDPLYYCTKLFGGVQEQGAEFRYSVPMFCTLTTQSITQVNTIEANKGVPSDPLYYCTKLFGGVQEQGAEFRYSVPMFCTLTTQSITQVTSASTITAMIHETFPHNR